MNSGKIVAGGRTDGWTDGWTGIEGSIRGPRGPKNIKSFVDLKAGLHKLGSATSRP